MSYRVATYENVKDMTGTSTYTFWTPATGKSAVLEFIAGTASAAATMSIYKGSAMADNLLFKIALDAYQGVALPLGKALAGGVDVPLICVMSAGTFTGCAMGCERTEGYF